VKASHFARDLTELLPLSPTPPESLVGREPYGRWNMRNVLWKVCAGEEAQDIAEYAVMLAVILVIVVGTIRLVGTNANNVFSSVASSVQ
jgi:Flp pilus assembly pilin Flp